MQGLLSMPRQESAVDILLVNPPAPASARRNRSQQRAVQRKYEKIVFSPVTLVLIVAIIHPGNRVKTVDARAEQMD